MAAQARARMRSIAVTLFMKNGSPWDFVLLPVLSPWEGKDARVRSASVLSCLSPSLWRKRDALLLVEAVGFVGTVPQLSPSRTKTARMILVMDIAGGVCHQ